MLEKNIIFTFNPIVGFLAADKLDDAWNAYKKIAADAEKEINDFLKGIQRINFYKMAIYGNDLHIEFDGGKALARWI